MVFLFSQQFSHRRRGGEGLITKGRVVVGRVGLRLKEDRRLLEDAPHGYWNI